MTIFFAIETLRGNKKLAWIQDDFALPFCINENSSKERIKNAKREEKDVSEEERALKALEEVNEQYDI